MAASMASQTEPVMPAGLPEQPDAPDRAKLKRAYQRLEQDIMSGAYGPNERLAEARLTRVFGISRNTLRTILVRLAQEGLVTAEPNRGWRVRAVSLAEANDMAQVRAVLEGLVARLAAERATEGQRADLRALLEQAERAAADDDFPLFSDLNHQFHQRLVAAAGSPQTAAFLDSLHFPLVKVQFRVMPRPERKPEMLTEHREVLCAVERRDPDAAERTARRHTQWLMGTLNRDRPHQPGPPVAAAS
jgi:DNA-binding GntR family transcriptional regulator